MTILESTLRQFPYPIAANVDRLIGEMEKPARSHTIEFFILIDIFESILKYLSLVTISNYIEKGPRDKRLDEIIRERFLGRPLSLGGWEDLLQTVLRYYRTRPGDFFVPGIIDFYFRKGGHRVRMTREAEQFKGFIPLRNEKLAHGGLKLESEYETLVEEYLPLMERVLHRLSFLESFELMIPLSSSGEMELLRCRGLDLQSEPVPSSLAIGMNQRENPLLWKRDNPSEHLVLYPLLFPELGRADGEDDLFFYEKNRRQARDSSKLQTLEYLGVRYKKHLKMREGDSYQPLISTFQNRLSPWMEKSPEMVDLSAPIYGFSEIQAVLKEYSSPFYGREDLVQNILREIQKGEGGYLLITGEPGSGKTALLAFLAKQLPQGLYHFLSPGANQVVRWLQALFEQLVKIYPSEGPVPTDKERVLQEFWEKAARIAEVEPLVIFLDALDELSDRDGHSLFFLPKELPPGLFVILSSRFGSIRDRTLSRFALRELQLPPLSEKVVKQWCRRDLGEKGFDDSGIHQLMVASRGNPLYIRFYLKCLQSRAQIQMGDELKDLFEERLSQIIDEMDEGVVLGLLGLLTVSRSGFSRRDLSEITGKNQLRVGKALRKLSEFVVERDEVYYLFHRTFREYAQDLIFTPSDLKNHHLRIANHYKSWEREVREYGLNHLCYHTFYSQDYSALLDLLRSGFLSQKARHFSDPLSLEEDFLYGIQAGLALKNPLVMVEFGLERAFLVRAVKSLSRSGLLPLFGGLGEIQKSLNLAHRLSDPEERSRALIQIALQLAPSYPEYAHSLLGEISEFSLRKEGALSLSKKISSDPLPFLEPLLNDPEFDEIPQEEREQFLREALPLLGRSRPGWALRLLEGLSLQTRGSILSKGASSFIEGNFREGWREKVEETKREIEETGWEGASHLVEALALLDFRQARAWVENLPLSQREEGLVELGLFAARRNRRKGAEEILKILPPSEGRERLLAELALLISEDLDQARGLIDEILDPLRRFEGRLRLLKKHPSPRIFADGQKDISALSSSALKQQATRDLGRAWVKENPVEASDLVRGIEGETLRISALKELGLRSLEGAPEMAREFLTLSSGLAILSGDRSARARAYGAIGGALPPSHKKEACELLEKALELTEKEPVGMSQPFAVEVISEVALRDVARAIDLSEALTEPVSRALALSESAGKVWDSQPDQGERLFQVALDLIYQLDSQGERTRLLSKALPLLARRDPEGAYHKTLLMEGSTTRRETLAEILALYTRTNFPRARELWEGEKDSTTRLVAGVAILQVLLEDDPHQALSLFDQILSETLALSEIQEKLYGFGRLRPLARRIDSIREQEVEKHLQEITLSLKKEDRARAERMVAQQGVMGKKADLVEDSLERLEKSIHLDVSYRAVREARERMVRVLLHKPLRQRMEEAILLSPEMDDHLLNLFPLFVRVISLLSDHSADLLLDLLGYFEDSSLQALSILSGSTIKLHPWEEAVCPDHTPLAHEMVDQNLQEEAEGEATPMADEDLLSIQREMGKAGEADLVRLKEIYLQRGDQRKALEILQDLATLMEKEGKIERAKSFYEEMISLEPDHPQALRKLKKALPEIPRAKPKPTSKVTREIEVELKEKVKSEDRKVSEKKVSDRKEKKLPEPEVSEEVREADGFMDTGKDRERLVSKTSPAEEEVIQFSGDNVQLWIEALPEISGGCLIRIEGAIESKNYDTFEEGYQYIFQQKYQRVLMDCTDLKYMNSTGLGGLIKFADRLMQQGGALHLYNLHSRHRVAVDMLGLQAFLKIYSTLDEAREAFRSLPPAEPPRPAAFSPPSEARVARQKPADSLIPFEEKQKAEEPEEGEGLEEDQSIISSEDEKGGAIDDLLGDSELDFSTLSGDTERGEPLEDLMEDLLEESFDEEEGGEVMEDLMEESFDEEEDSMADLLDDSPDRESLQPQRGLKPGTPTPTPHKRPERGEDSGYGSFEILRQIGQGGMGEVFLVEDRQTRRGGVMKVLDGLDPGQWMALETLLSGIFSSLIHRQIIGIFGWGQGPLGKPFVVFENFEGQSLHEILREEGLLLKSQAASITSGVSQALEFLHSQGVFFPSLTPSDIFISGSGEVKIDIFGALYFAMEKKRSGGTLTQAGTQMGSPDYLSPEMVWGIPLDHRSDLYSLGSIFFEMVTGKKPFIGPTPAILLSKKISENPPSAEEVNPSLGHDPALETFLQRALERDQENRFQSAEEFARACEGLIYPSAPPVGGPFQAPATSKKPGPAPRAMASGKSAGKPSRRAPQTFNLAPAEYRAKSKSSNLFSIFALVLILMVMAAGIYFLIKWLF